MNSNRRLADVLDGASQTFAMGEAVSGRYILAQDSEGDPNLYMGQVWTKASFDGEPSYSGKGGRGSVLAVTQQNPGPDGIYGTADDVLAPMNPFASGVQVSVDTSFDNSCTNLNDRVRNFASAHRSGANFLFTDGSVRYVSERIDFWIYRALSTIQGGETPDEF